MAYQLAYAAIHCQDNLICNVSLDPRHVMVQNIEGVMSRAADDIPVRRLILADFSGSRQFCDGIAIVDAEFSPVSYSAPELLFGSWNATFNSDAWQLACVLYEMATGDVLFPIKMPGDHRKVKAQIAELMTSNDLQFEAVFFPKFKEKTKKYKSLGIQVCIFVVSRCPIPVSVLNLS